MLQSALAQAEQDPAILKESEKHLIPLTFGSVRPRFDEADGVFRQLAEFAIGML